MQNIYAQKTEMRKLWFCLLGVFYLLLAINNAYNFKDRSYCIYRECISDKDDSSTYQYRG